MRRTKQWWSNLTKDERSELTRLEREETQEERDLIREAYNWEEPDNWCEPDILCCTKYEDDSRREHLSNLKRITEIIEKANNLI